MVIAGQPNAGKSSLLNALAGAELAIVTPIPGTTRDKVSQLIQIEGVPLHIVDTAGLRDSSLPEVDEVEKIGIARAWDEICTADAVLFLHDLSRKATLQETSTALAYAADEARIQTLLAENLPPHIPVIDVWNKSDIAPDTVLAEPVSGWVISSKTGAGLPSLRKQLLQLAGWQATGGGVFMARQRHVLALTRVQSHLTQASLQLQSRSPALDLLAEDLRQAQLTLGQITGAFTPDELLGEIFSKFCIGK